MAYALLGSAHDLLFLHPTDPWRSWIALAATRTNAGAYGVRVVQRWSASWELGGRRGERRNVNTEGIIEDFEVRDLQALRKSLGGGRPEHRTPIFSGVRPRIPGSETGQDRGEPAFPS